MTVGERIIRRMQERGLTHEALAKRLSVSVEDVTAWERGEVDVTAEELVRIKDALGVSLDALLADDVNENAYNKDSLDTVCGALSYAMGITPPRQASEKNSTLSEYVDKIFNGERADRIIMYNPDAIAQWVYEKYPSFLEEMRSRTDIDVPLQSVMPSVTPVCFGTMYTGAQPCVHGIQKYEKPVIRIDTFFDALIAAGKRPALITYSECSLSRIYRERDMDYFHYEDGGISQVNAKAMELILRNEHDVIVIYNGNYDSVMHKNGPESARSLAELRVNDMMFSAICEAVKEHWTMHNTLVGFAMDHGCHEIDGGCGSHGLDMPEDLNILHRYVGYPKKAPCDGE